LPGYLFDFIKFQPGNVSITPLIEWFSVIAYRASIVSVEIDKQTVQVV